MSGKQERERRRQERMAQESKADTGDRRKRMMQMGAGAVFLAIVAVVVAIVVAGSGGDDGGDAGNLSGVSEVKAELGGIEQNGLVLGDPNAPVELVEFGDLQCPVCKAASEETLPPVIEGQIAQGQAKIAFRNFTIISDESVPAAQAAVAAGMQGVGWTFVDVFYKNQGPEASGYVTDEFLTAIAEAAGVADIQKWDQDRNSEKVETQVSKEFNEAQQLGLSGTPSFAVDGPGTNGLEPIGSTTGEIEDAIDAAS